MTDPRPGEAAGPDTGTAAPGGSSETMTLRPGETAATHRWSEIMYWPLTIAAVAFLITYTIHVIGDLQGLAATITLAIIGAVWLLFVVDYVVRLSLADPRSAWFRTHLYALATVLVPAVRPVRLLDTFARLGVFGKSAVSYLRAKLLVYGIGSALLLIWYISLIVLQSERHAPGATIVTYGESVWWAFCTITTVGYGDYVPVTVPGRIAAVALMVGGVVLVGLIVASMSSLVYERAATNPRPELNVPTLHLRRRRKDAVADGGTLTSDADEVAG